MGEPCNVASVELTAAFRRVEPSVGFAGTVQRPCALVLTDGRRIERVLCVEDRRGFATDSWIHPASIAEVAESPSRLPARLANKLYRAGESGMGYHIFVVKLRSGGSYVCATGNTVDFPGLPEGITSKDIVDVEPHAGRRRSADEGYKSSADFETCYYLPADYERA